jgi:3'-phosphoadenosine 5'-phosphosulfate sulfotransferase (PAPS reductase)/FAD synthetase
MTNLRHVLGLSGGKDSTALALYLHQRHPELQLDYYFCDTGKELDEVYQTIERLEVALGQKIRRLKAAEGTSEDTPFDHFLEMYGGFLPSSQARWCTKKLKLDPFERFVGEAPTVSYVGIRDDEDREGYISQKRNIQSLFPFRQNIWSQDVIRRVLANDAIEQVLALYRAVVGSQLSDRLTGSLISPVSAALPQGQKLQQLLDADTPAFNHVVFRFLQQTESGYPLTQLASFPLLDNADRLVKADVFRLLEDSGVGVPQYYQNVEFEVDGQKGSYARSRSGCFFCFFQQKIEWVWLLENHPELYQRAMAYEKDGFSWGEGETLAELAEPERVTAIKREFLKRSQREKPGSGYLMDILDGEGEGCAACFV